MGDGMRTNGFFVFATICTVSCTVGQAADVTAVLGQAAPKFDLEDLSGNNVSLRGLAGKRVVIEWFNPGCPFVEYAHDVGGPLASAAAQTISDEVAWVAINSSAGGKQGHGTEANVEAKKRWSMDHPILLDEDGRVGRAYGAATTPHMYVIDKNGVLVYRGGLDNQPMGRGDTSRTDFVAAALADLAAGRAVARPETKPYGCRVKYSD